MSPIEVSEKPRRAKSLRLASMIFVRARGSPRRGRVKFAASPGDWSDTSHGRDYPMAATRPFLVDLFGKLVPALAISQPRPQFPAAALGGAVQCGDQSLQPSRDPLPGLEPG